jgi:PAS domain S-box-containing protein
MENNILEILIIDDNQNDVQLINKYLKDAEDFNFKLVHKNKLSDGLKKIEEKVFNIILLDLTLPDCSGFETVLRARAKSAKIPIIILTGLNNEKMARRAVETGAEDYLIKGKLDSNVLVRSIFHAIERNQMKIAMESLTHSLQINEVRFRKIIEKNSDAIVILDQDGKACFINPTAEIMFNEKEENFIGQFFISPEELIEKSEIEIKNGRDIIIAEIQSVEIEWEKEVAYLLTLRDITERKRIDKELMETEKKYRNLFENSPYPIIIGDQNERIIDCNVSLEKLIRHDKNDIINSSFEDSPLVPQNYISLFKKNYLSVLEGNKEKPIKIEVKLQNGSILWLNLKFSLMTLSNQKLVHILIENVTLVKQSEQEVERLSQTLHEMNALIEHAPQAILLIHPGGKILRINEKAKDLVKLDEDILLSSRIYELFDEESIDIIKKHYDIDIYNLSTPDKIEALIKTNDGTRINVEVMSTILKIADHLIIQSFFSDITERKNFEKNRQLLTDQLIASLDFKTKFLANMSHELRTPLNAILGFSQLLLEKSFGDVNEEQSEFIQDIYTSGEHLLSLINAILDISKFEAGKFDLNLETINLNDFIENVNVTIKALFLNKSDIKYSVQGIKKDDVINVDPLRFKQILFNLLVNAIKFTEKGYVILRGIEKVDYWEFQIEDSGIGIAKEDYDVVFREFGRIENDKTRDISGAGLGLALTKRLVNLHGGEIWFKSEFGKGSLFCFIIPQNKEQN